MDEHATPFPVWYASWDQRPGCVIALGGITYFSPVQDPHVYPVPDRSAVHIAGRIAEPLATYVRGEIAAKFAQAGPRPR
jgi:hypothetical protein